MIVGSYKSFEDAWPQKWPLGCGSFIQELPGLKWRECVPGPGFGTCWLCGLLVSHHHPKSFVTFLPAPIPMWLPDCTSGLSVACLGFYYDASVLSLYTNFPPSYISYISVLVFKISYWFSYLKNLMQLHILLRAVWSTVSCKIWEFLVCILNEEKKKSWNKQNFKTEKANHPFLSHFHMV